MKLVITTAALMLSATLALSQQRNLPMQRIDDILPAGVVAELITLTADAQRVYYTRPGPTPELWLYDRERKVNSRVSSWKSSAFDMKVAPGGDALLYTINEEQIWILPLNPRTGLAAGPHRRLTRTKGLSGSFSPDGKEVAFTRNDDSAGYSLMTVASAGGPERFESSGEPLPVNGDPDALEQLFVNLLLNAGHALDSGGAAHISVARTDSNLFVDITDNGHGIPPEDLERILQPFVTTRPDGTGLGLPISIQIAAAHGGSLKVQSEVGGGTRVRVHLPTQRVQGP